MTPKEKRKLVKDILKRDQFTGASMPLYQNIPQLTGYFREEGVYGWRMSGQRAKDLGLDDYDFKGKTVLDIGADNGMMMWECFKRGAKLTVGVEHPEVGDEAKRVAELLGNKSAKFVHYDLKTVTTGGLQTVCGRKEFDVVMYLAIDSFLGQFPKYLYQMTKELLIYEKMIDSVSFGETTQWLIDEGFSKVEFIGVTKDIPSNYGIIRAWK